MTEDEKIASRYLSSDRTPHFAPGYSAYKEKLVLEAVTDPVLSHAFQRNLSLPEGYGARIDERVVEYPWVFVRLPESGTILDAGSTFNKERLLNADLLRNRSLIIYTLESDRLVARTGVSYLFGDLRDMLLKDACVDAVVCISTLEHVGFTYDYKQFSKSNRWPYARPDSYLDAVREFRRVLRPGGKLLLTVPYGRYEDHGWLQQFDAERISAVKQCFEGHVYSEAYYRYVDGFWRIADPEECAELSYFNIHETGKFESDGAAAARAVCCLELGKV